MFKNGQTVLTFMFMLFLFVIVWAFFVAPMMGIGADYGKQSGATGLEMFLLGNMNIIIAVAIGLLIFWLARRGWT